MTESPGKDLSETEHAKLLSDLQRRIETLHESAESDFGLFTTGDWIVCVGGFLLLPWLLYFWFWP